VSLLLEQAFQRAGLPVKRGLDPMKVSDHDAYDEAGCYRFPTHSETVPRHTRADNRERPFSPDRGLLT